MTKIEEHNVALLERQVTDAQNAIVDALVSGANWSRRRARYTVAGGNAAVAVEAVRHGLLTAAEAALLIDNIDRGMVAV